MWFRRKQRESVPFDLSRLPEAPQPTLEEAISEGVMLAEFAGRMALKNQIVIGALTDPEPFDLVRYADAARAILADLADESTESASRAALERESARGREGKGQHQHDYRVGDLGNLHRRESVNTGVAERLAQLGGDDDYLARFVERARDDAWSEIGAAITARLDRQWPALAVGATPASNADSPRNHDKRMRELRRDLHGLAREHARDSAKLVKLPSNGRG